MVYKDAKKLAKISTNLGAAMVGISDLKDGTRVFFREREGGNPSKRAKHSHETSNSTNAPHNTW